ncbi:MAG: hypothetical protein IT331_05790 [Anaerolineae bacterium]|nr:hypothetical protein [Anaerolineae bacterium]
MTPENMVQNTLPFFAKTGVKVLATPRVSQARFGEYLLELAPGAFTTRAVGDGFENFLYLLSGTAQLESAGRILEMREGTYAYLPDSAAFMLQNQSSEHSRVLWVKKVYAPVKGLDVPSPVYGHLAEVPRIETSVPNSWRQVLLPIENPAFDMAMNVLSFKPGVFFDQVEIHHQEHGLYMIQGQGIYYLGSQFHEIKQDDFIYMAPYCPQLFYAIGDNESAYLLYKDVNRDGYCC